MKSKNLLINGVIKYLHFGLASKIMCAILIIVFIPTVALSDIITVTVLDTLATTKKGKVINQQTITWDTQSGSLTVNAGYDPRDTYYIYNVLANGVPMPANSSVTLDAADYDGVTSVSVNFLYKYTPTPSPSPTPSATPTLEPTPTLSPTAEPTETPTPSLTPMETPTPELTATPTAEPTEILTPELTVEPTETPISELIATPTLEPAETTTLEPTAEPTPTQTPIATSTLSSTETVTPVVTLTPLPVQPTAADDETIETPCLTDIPDLFATPIATKESDISWPPEITVSPIPVATATVVPDKVNPTTPTAVTTEQPLLENESAPEATVSVIQNVVSLSTSDEPSDTPFTAEPTETPNFTAEEIDIEILAEEASVSAVAPTEEPVLTPDVESTATRTSNNNKKTVFKHSQIRQTVHEMSLSSVFPDGTHEEAQMEYAEQYLYVVVPLIDGYGSFLLAMRGDGKIEVGYSYGNEQGDFNWLEEYDNIAVYKQHNDLIVDYVIVVGDCEIFYFITQEEFDEKFSQFNTE